MHIVFPIDTLSKHTNSQLLHDSDYSRFTKIWCQHKLISSHSIWECSVSSKQCLIGIQSRMGMNLIGLHSLPGPLGASGLRVHPSGSSGRPGRRSTPSYQDLVVITYKYRGQSARMHKTAQKRSNSQQILF